MTTTKTATKTTKTRAKAGAKTAKPAKATTVVEPAAPTAVDVAAATAARFWSKVDKNGPVPVGTEAEGNCWDWTASTRGGKDRDYGQFRVGQGVTTEAHRYAWMLENGDVPEGKILGHLCKRTICVRPSHKRPMTRMEAGQYRTPSATSMSGVRGVSWNNQAKKWKVSVSVNGVTAHGGYFPKDKKPLAAKRAEELREELLAKTTEQ